MYVKSVTKYYYKNMQMVRHYKFLKGDLSFTEKKIRNLKIINSNIKFDKDNSFIDKLVFDTRKYLLLEHGFNHDFSKFKNIDLTNYCHKSAIYIKKICDKNNIKSYILPIYPGYYENNKLYNGNGYHFANIIKYNSNYYLVDITYSQFFYIVRNNLDRLGIVGTGGCNPGVFMLMTEKGRKIANTLISDGYIELNDEVFKTYLDAFTISFRNGLYYENTLDFSYTTEYSLDDYIRFIHGDDNQINHEDKLYLGYQSKPLKNYKLNFKKR